MDMEKQLWELWDMRLLQKIASDFSVRFPISHMGISAATFKAAESMVRKKASGMETPYS